MKYYDAPLIRFKDDMVDVFHLCSDRKHLTKYSFESVDKIESKRLEFGLGKIKRSVVKDSYTPNQAVFKAYSRIFVVSDVEGNWEAARKLLIKYDVIDKEGKWLFGDGHLVILGDVVHKGPDMVSALWDILNIRRRASKKGGHVHCMLGNHEIMLLMGDDRYLHKEQQQFNVALKGHFHQFFDTENPLGAWIRSWNTLLQIGPFLFVHGGISKWLLDLSTDIDEVNNSMRELIFGLHSKIKDTSHYFENSLISPLGPLWYRGYFKDHKTGLRNLEDALNAFDVKTIVVGHTRMERIYPFYKNCLWAVNSGFDKNGAKEGLLILPDNIHIMR